MEKHFLAPARDCREWLSLKENCLDRVDSRTRVELGHRSKVMHIALWLVQILLAILFLMTGAMKAFMPLDEVAKTMRWVPDVPAGLVRFIGLVELAGAL